MGPSGCSESVAKLVSESIDLVDLKWFVIHHFHCSLPGTAPPCLQFHGRHTLVGDARAVRRCFALCMVLGGLYSLILQVVFHSCHMYACLKNFRWSKIYIVVHVNICAIYIHVCIKCTFPRARIVSRFGILLHLWAL